MNLRFTIHNLLIGLIITHLSILQSHATGCNDVNAGHLFFNKNNNKTILGLNKHRLFSVLNYLSDAECRYRKTGTGSWVIAASDCAKYNLPTVGSLLDCEFTLNTESGGVEYDYEIRVKCTLDGWGNWYSSKFNSYCGPDGIETEPSSIKATELEYRSSIAEEGKLSRDGGQTFFKTEQYVNNVLIFKNLEPNTQYWFKCRTKCDHNNQWAAFTTLKSVRTSCETPPASSLNTFGADMGTHIGISCERNASMYEFNMRKKGESQWRSSGSTQNDRYTFPDNIVKGDIYEFRCRLDCSGNWTNYSTIVEGSIPVQCLQPIIGEIGVNQITNNSAHFFCRSGHHDNVVEKHIFRYRKQNGSNWTEKRSDNNDVDVSRLDSNTDYVMQVQHECTNGVTGNWSNMINFTTNIHCDVDNTDVSFANVSYTSVDLNCDQSNRDGYTWEVKRVRDDRKLNIPNPISQNIYTLSGLDQWEEYSVRLKVHCGNETSDWTDIKTFVTSRCFVSQEDVNVGVISNHEALFTFNGNTQSGLEWQYRKMGNSNWKKVNTNSNNILIDSLVGNAVYEFRMRIKCQEFPLTYSDYTTIELFETGCNSQINRFSNITPTSITVHATDVNASEYIFKLMLESGNSIERISNSHMYTFSQLTPNTNYEFQVKAICNNSMFSVSAFATTEESLPTQCLAPHRGQISKSNVTSNSAELHCSKGNVDGYYFRSGRDVATGQSSGLLSEGYFQLTGLIPSTIYWFQCRVKCGTELSDWSDTVKFRTQAQTFGISQGCPPPYDQELLSINIGSSSCTLICFTEADLFKFRYRDTASQIWIELPEQSSNRVLLNSLSGQTMYEFQCQLSCNGSYGPSSESKYFITQSQIECLPIESSNFYAINIRRNEATLLSLNQALLYRFRYKEYGSDSWTSTDTSSNPLIKINQLKPDATYLYQVQILCNNGKISSYSRSKFFKTDEDCAFDNKEDVKINILNDTTVEFTLAPGVRMFKPFAIMSRYRELGGNGVFHNIEWTHINRILKNVKRKTKYELQGLVYCTEKNHSQWSESTFFETGSVATHDINSSLINLYPNPGNGLIHVKAPYSTEVSVYNLYGQQVYQFYLEKTVDVIDISSLPNGLYILKLESEFGKQSIQYFKTF